MFCSVGDLRTLYYAIFWNKGTLSLFEKVSTETWACAKKFFFQVATLFLISTIYPLRLFGRVEYTDIYVSLIYTLFFLF